MSRSVKYKKLSDKEILELTVLPQPERDQYFLLQEVSFRGLDDQLASKKKTYQKETKAKLTPAKILFLLMMASMFMFMIAPRLIEGF